MNMHVSVALLVLTLSAVGCGYAAVIPPLTPAGAAVTVQKSDPPPGAVEVGHVTASHGECCGSFGAKGSYEGAYAELKNRAGTLGANFVRIDLVEFPRAEVFGAWNNTYILRGVAFKTK